MPATLSYPGVYIEEIPSGVRTIIGVPTSITAFLGRAPLGPTNEPVSVNSFGDFERTFGGLAVDCPMSYAVRDFYINGGSQALIVRLYQAKALDTVTNTIITVDDLTLEAVSEGAWGKDIRVMLDPEVPDEVRTRLKLAADAPLFNVTATRGKRSERYLNVTLADTARRVDRVLAAESSLIRTPDGWAKDIKAKLAKVGDAAKAWAAVAAAKKADGAKAEDIQKAQDAYTAAKRAISDPVSQAEAALADEINAVKPDQGKIDAAKTALKKATDAQTGADSEPLTDQTYFGVQADKTGIYALDRADLFNLLCIPPDQQGSDTRAPVYQTAMSYCALRRAMLLVDPLSAWSAVSETAASKARDGLATLGLSGEAARNAALYFPRLRESDPLREGQLDTYVPCGAVAGIMTRTDNSRGVWKAPAGLDAAVNGIQGFDATLNDAENGMLNPLGINCLRAFPINGRVVWGARTLRGADQLADEYKYVPVRRTALYIEESLYRGTQWVVFEPNDEPLWAQIRLNVGAFMHGLFRLGAFQGATPRDAYFVKCDKETTTQDDINKGIVNILVGFAPLKPAEFVVIQLQQIAGQIQT